MPPEAVVSCSRCKREQSYVFDASDAADVQADEVHAAAHVFMELGWNQDGNIWLCPRCAVAPWDRVSSPA